MCPERALSGSGRSPRQGRLAPPSPRGRWPPAFPLPARGQRADRGWLRGSEAGRGHEEAGRGRDAVVRIPSSSSSGESYPVSPRSLEMESDDRGAGSAFLGGSLFWRSQSSQSGSEQSPDSLCAGETNLAFRPKPAKRKMNSRAGGRFAGRETEARRLRPRKRLPPPASSSSSAGKRSSRGAPEAPLRRGEAQANAAEKRATRGRAEAREDSDGPSEEELRLAAHSARQRRHRSLSAPAGPTPAAKSNGWTPRLERELAAVREQASFLAHVHDLMASRVRRLNIFIAVGVGGITTLSGAEGLAAVAGGEERAPPAWMRVVTLCLSFVAAMLLALGQAHGLSKIYSDSLAAQAGYSNLVQEINLQLSFDSDDRQPAVAFVRKVLQAMSELRLSAPTVFRRVRRQAERARRSAHQYSPAAGEHGASRRDAAEPRARETRPARFLQAQEPPERLWHAEGDGGPRERRKDWAGQPAALMRGGDPPPPFLVSRGTKGTSGAPGEAPGPGTRERPLPGEHKNRAPIAPAPLLSLRNGERTVCRTCAAGAGHLLCECTPASHERAAGQSQIFYGERTARSTSPARKSGPEAPDRGALGPARVESTPAAGVRRPSSREKYSTFRSAVRAAGGTRREDETARPRAVHAKRALAVYCSPPEEKSAPLSVLFGRSRSLGPDGADASPSSSLELLSPLPLKSIYVPAAARKTATAAPRDPDETPPLSGTETSSAQQKQTSSAVPGGSVKYWRRSSSRPSVRQVRTEIADEKHLSRAGRAPPPPRIDTEQVVSSVLPGGSGARGTHFRGRDWDAEAEAHDPARSSGTAAGEKKLAAASSAIEGSFGGTADDRPRGFARVFAEQKARMRVRQEKDRFAFDRTRSSDGADCKATTASGSHSPFVRIARAPAREGSERNSFLFREEQFFLRGGDANGGRNASHPAVKNAPAPAGAGSKKEPPAEGLRETSV